MCGIAGIIRFDGRPVAKDALDQACATLLHRGPDDSGLWIDAECAIGLVATRLAVLDPTPAGHQPMSRAEGRYQLVYNGEIYNYRELRAELADAGEVFATDTDTEVLLAACSRWGTEALPKLNGMWAFAFFDRRRREGFLARDPWGIKPLFYSADARRLTFASELRPLRRIEPFDDAVDADALAEHLTFGYISGEKSIYRGARRLEPGCCLPFNDQGAKAPVAQGRPGRPHADPPETLDYAESCRRLRRLMSESVTLRRVADVPIGAFLSGGLDSSIVVAHLAESLGRPVHTFSVGYERHSAYDETGYARLAAARFGAKHHELILTARDVLDSIPALLDHLGEPVGDSSIVPTALLSRFARGHVTVALGGDAGDELFGGYWRYLAQDSWAAYRRIPRLLRRWLIEPLAGAGGVSKSSVGADRRRQLRKLLRAEGTVASAPRIDPNPAASYFRRHLVWSRILEPDAAARLLPGGIADGCFSAALCSAMAAANGLPDADPLNRVLAFDLHHQLPADMLQKVDLAGMMHSLEIRVPFLDPALVGFAAALPSRFKVHGGLRKRILVDAYRGRLPDEILDRPKKGFEVPIGEYFRGPLGGVFRDVVTRDVIESFGLVCFAGVQRLFADHLARTNEHADILFALLSLAWWKRQGKNPPDS